MASHRLLQRQLKKLNLDENTPPGPEAWMKVLARIERTYKEADQDRYLLERSLAISSQEMQGLYDGLKQASETRIAIERDRLKAVMDNVLEGIVTFNSVGEIQSFNRAAEMLFGYPAGEAIGMDFSRLMKDPANGSFKKNGQKVLDLEEREVFPRELTGRRKDGSTFLMELSISDMKLGEEKTSIAIIRDITTRVQAEIALRNSEEKYRLLIENASEAVVVAVDGKFGYVNPKTVEITGYSREELIGRPFPQVIHPEDRDLVIQRHVDRLRGTAVPNGYSFRIVTAGGDFKWVAINAVVIDWQGKPATLNFLSDITERVRAEQALREERDRAQMYLDVAGTILLAIGKDQRVVLINRKGCEVLGWAEDELVGQNWFDHFVPAPVRESVRANFNRLLAGDGEDLAYYENPVLARDGKEHLVAWHNRVLNDQDGEIVGVLSSGEDITERRAVDRNLRRHVDIMALFNSMNDSLNRGSSLQEIINLMAEGTREIFSCNGATVYLLQNDGSELVIQNLTIPEPNLGQLEALIGLPVSQLRFETGRVTRYHRVLAENRPLMVNDMEKIHEHMEEIAEAVTLGNESARQGLLPLGPRVVDLLDIRSMMIVPLMAGERAVGLLEISRYQAFEQDDLERFASIAQPLSAAIQRKQADDALRESEERYRQLFENAPVGLGIADEQGNLLDFNTAMLQPGGYTRADIEKVRKVSDLYADPQMRVRTLELARRQGYLTRHPVRFKRKDQSAYDALLSLTPIHVNGTRYWQAMVEDLSERQASEKQLLLQATVLKAAANAIVITDRQGDITWVNPAFTRLTGYSVEEVLGGNPRILNSGSHDVAFYDELWATILAGEVWQGEVINRKKSGELYTEEMTITPVHGDDGEISHFIAVKQDITDRVRAEAETRRRNRELTLLNRVIAAASSTLEPEPILEIICSELARAFDVPQAAATLLYESGDALEVVAEYLAEGRPSALGAVIPLEGNPATQHVLETKVPLAVDDAQTDSRMAPIHRLMEERGTVSLLILPLVVRNRVIGTIGLDAITPRTFSEDEIDLASAVASTAAQAIDTARLFAETRRRAGELEAVAEVSSAMRTAATRAEMYPIILNRLLFLLQADGAKLALLDPATGDILIQLARGAWAAQTGKRLPPGEGLIGKVIASARPYLNYASEPSLAVGRLDLNGGLPAIACVPLIANEQAIGAICVGRQDSFNEDDQNLLNAICDMTANAIHRASLYEQTERRLQRLGALRMIDEAITASVDLRLTLNILLEQVANQLSVDAAAVLLLSPHTKVLEVAARRGFHTGALRNTRLRLGESDAGRAALTRQTVHMPDLPSKSRDTGRAAVLAREGFVDYYAVPLIAKGQVKGVLEIFNRQSIAADPEWLDFLETLAGRAAIAIDNISLFDSLQRSNVELTLAYDATIEGWASALELRDRETKGHSQRVTDLTLQLASALGLTESELEHTRRGTLLHDIGKMGIPDQILNKPGPLTDQEWEIMRQHPVYAYNMLTPIAYLRPALDIPYCHHEKWDGSGYPRGLVGEQIPITARIFAVVDVWDALRSDRPYRAAWPEKKALQYIQDEAGKHFDPHIVNEFMKLIEQR